MILPPRVSRRIRAGAPLGWLAWKAWARTPAVVAEPPGCSSVTSTANRRRTREEPGNRHSIASASRWPVPGGPATAGGAVRPANWASRIKNGSPPKWSPCRCEPANVTVTPAGVRLTTEPARDVEPELLARHHGTQPDFQVGQAASAQRARPPGADVLEDHRGQGQHLDAARGKAGQLAPSVGVVAGAVHVAELLEPVDRLARGLLGDAEPAARLGGRGPAQPDRLQGEAVRRAHVGMAAAGQLRVQLVDDRPETAEQQQRQLETMGVI